MIYFSGTISLPELGYFIDEWDVVSVEIAADETFVGATTQPNQDGEYTIGTEDTRDRLVTLMLHQPFGEPWSAGDAVQVGDYRRPGNFAGYVFRCTGSGTTGASEPDWNQRHGDTTADNGVTWVAIKYLGVDSGKGKFVQGPYFAYGEALDYVPTPAFTWQGESAYTPSSNLTWS